MKLKLLFCTKVYLFAIALFFGSNAFCQFTNINGLPIAYWDFESNTNRATVETTVEQAINPNCSFIGKTGGASTTVCQYAGRGIAYGGAASGSAMIAGGWTAGTSAGATYFEFRINTSGFSGVGLNFDILSLGSLANYPLAALSYSTDGGTTFSAYGANLASRNAWNNWLVTLPAAADNKTDVRIRFSGYYSNNSANCTSNGLLALDNFQVFATSTILNAGSKTTLNELGLYTSFTSGGAANQWIRYGTFSINSGSTLNLGSDIYLGNTTVAGAITVNSGGTLDCGAVVSRQLMTIASGLSTVTVSSGGSIIVRSPLGIAATGATGNIQTTNRVFNAAANYTYSNSSAASYSQITGTGLPTAMTGNLTINNASNVSLTTTTIGSSPGTLFLTNGKFILGTNSYTADNISGGSASSYVCTDNTGTLNRTVGGVAVDFPVGKIAYNPVRLTNTGTQDQYQIRVIDNVTNDGTGIGATTLLAVVKRTWMISETTPGGSNTTIRLYWNGTGEEINGFSASTAFMAHYVSSAGLWDNLGGVVVGTGYVETAGNDSFSPYTISSTGVFAPLPTELVSFQANCTNDNRAELTWSTASENNSSYFNVERSRDGMNWDVIGVVQAAGSSLELLNYSASDNESIFGTRYYRLVQYDLNGEFELFDLLSLNCEGMEGEVGMKVYPNPGNGNFTLDFMNDNSKGPASIHLTSIRGEILYSQPIWLTAGMNTFFIDKNLPSGVYFVSVKQNNGSTQSIRYIRE